MKVCKKCSFTGDNTNFYDRELVCKPCRILKVKEYYNENKEEKKKYIAAWAKRNPEKTKAYQAKARTSYPERFKDYSARHRMKVRYGITLEKYKQMYEDQSGLCFICHQPESVLNRNGTTKRLALDHCHETGRVRKLLCDNCNKGLGVFQDNPDRLRAAAKYLEGDFYEL